MQTQATQHPTISGCLAYHVNGRLHTLSNVTGMWVPYSVKHGDVMPHLPNSRQRLSEVADELEEYWADGGE